MVFLTPDVKWADPVSTVIELPTTVIPLPALADTLILAPPATVVIAEVSPEDPDIVKVSAAPIITGVPVTAEAVYA